RRAGPAQVGGQRRGRRQGLPRLPHGGAEAERAGAEGDPADGRPGRRDEVRRRGGDEGDEALLGGGGGRAGTGRVPVGAGVALPAVPAGLRAVRGRVAPVTLSEAKRVAVRAPSVSAG